MGAKILMCDDSEDMIMITKFILEGEGYKVTVASNTNEISKQIREGEFNLVLMDIGLPPDGGIAAVKEIQNNPATSDVPILLLSGQEGLSDLAEKLGVAGSLSKPYDGKSLVKKIKETLQIHSATH
jgi:CheY-like chemotaxis protein